MSQPAAHKHSALPEKVWNASNLLLTFPFTPGKTCYLRAGEGTPPHVIPALLLLRLCITSAPHRLTDKKQTLRNRYAITDDSYFRSGCKYF